MTALGARLGRLLRRPRARALPVASVQVELTNHCNYACRLCPQSRRGRDNAPLAPYDRPRGFMEPGLFREVVAQAARCANEINLSFFGEQTLHPRFEEYMRVLAGRPASLRVVLNTNLSRLTRHTFALFREMRLDDLRLSIDAATSRTYDLVRPGAQVLDLDGAPATGDRFRAIRAKAEYWFALPGHTPTRHVFPVSSANRHEMRDFADFWLPRLGPGDLILFKNVLTYGGKVDDPMIQDAPCNAWDQDMLTVAWDGRVTPCNLDTNLDLAIGSVLERPLEELFRGPERAAARARARDRDAPPCSTCRDSNNWSRNIALRQGDAWREEIALVFRDPRCGAPARPGEAPCPG